MTKSDKLLAQDDVIKQKQAEWKTHFVHTGQGGADDLESALLKSTQVIKSVFEGVNKPYSGMDPLELKAQIEAINLQGGDSLASVIEETGELIGKNSIFVQHPHCIAHLHTQPLVPSLAAEVFISALNQSMDSWDQASAATYVEQRMVDWLCDIYNFGEQSDGVFTAGGTQSNQMGLIIARDWIADSLSQHNIQQDGLPEYASKLRIICSQKSHFTVQKTAALMGLGMRAVVCVESRTNGTMVVEKLDQTIAELKAEGLIPFVVVGTAGTTDHGAIDDLNAIADVAQANNMWFHVDAAYGGALILSGEKHRLAGMERADSLTVDFHKLYWQPISCGGFLLKDKANFKYLLHHADYLNREDDTLPNLVDKTMATTKRFDALKLLMTMQTVGPNVLGEMYDHLLQQTRDVAEMVSADSHYELLSEPNLSTVLFRYNDGEHSDVDAINKKLRLEALVKGVAVLGETTVNGQTALKFTLLNPCLALTHFRELLDNLTQLAKSLA